VDRLPALVLALFAGGLIAFQPPVNALLAKHVSALGAAFVSLSVSLAIVSMLLVVSGGLGELSGIGEIRPVHLLGGVGGAVIVAASIPTVGALGAAGLTAALVTTQLTASLVIDRLGLLGVDQADITLSRVLGVLLLVAGMLLVLDR
jgi:transporter family-2 protein